MIIASSSCTRLLSLGLLALGLSSCGSAEQPLGDSEQPITARDDEAAGAGGDACSGGVSPEDAAPEDCQVVGRGLCFATAEAACACAGCGADECALAESFPAQAVCPSGNVGSNPDAPVSDGSASDAPVSSGAGVSSHSGHTSPGSPGCAGIDAIEPDPAGDTAPDPGGEPPCDYVVDGVCFEDADAACASAGCAPGACRILESYPAQIRCSS